MRRGRRSRGRAARSAAVVAAPRAAQDLVAALDRRARVRRRRDAVRARRARPRRQGHDRALRVVAAVVRRAALHRRAEQPPRRRGLRAQGHSRRDQLRHQAVLPTDVLLPRADLRVERDVVVRVAQLVARAAAARLRGAIDDGSRVRSLRDGAALAGVGDVRHRDVRAAQRADAAGRRVRSPRGADHRGGGDTGLGRAVVVLGAQRAVAAGGAAHARHDRRAARGRMDGTRRDSAGAAFDARDRGRARLARQLRVHAVERAPAPRRSARRAALRIAGARAGWAQRADRARVVPSRHRGRASHARARELRRRRARLPQRVSARQAAGQARGQMDVRDVHAGRPAGRLARVYRATAAGAAAEIGRIKCAAPGTPAGRTSR